MASKQDTTPTLAVHVTPKSGKDEVLGIATADDGLREVRIRVTAPPENGKANKAVCKLVASALGVSKSSVNVVRGDTSHHKILSVGCSAETLSTWVSGLKVL